MKIFSFFFATCLALTFNLAYANSANVGHCWNGQFCYIESSNKCLISEESLSVAYNLFAEGLIPRNCDVLPLMDILEDILKVDQVILRDALECSFDKNSNLTIGGGQTTTTTPSGSSTTSTVSVTHTHNSGSITTSVGGSHSTTTTTGTGGSSSSSNTSVNGSVSISW